MLARNRMLDIGMPRVGRRAIVFEAGLPCRTRSPITLLIASSAWSYHGAILF
jgi:hypothetical protein